MTSEIYYFTGTGNSFAVALKLAENIGSAVKAIAGSMKQDRIRIGAEITGIVFPVHYTMNNGGVPMIVKRFISKLEGAASRYIFAVCTCLMSNSIPLINLDRMLRLAGAGLSAGFSVQMPSNVYPQTEKQRNRLLKKMEIDVINIAQKVLSGKKGIFVPSHGIISFFMAPVMKKLKKSIQANVSKLAGRSDLPFEDLMPLIDNGFRVREDCDGCGICARVCPAGNIEISGARPAWKHRCENCLACINFCPKEAITGGPGTLYRYLHPDVKPENVGI